MSDTLSLVHPDDVDEPLITLACPECGEAIEGRASGRGSASWKLGTHRRVKHGVQGDSRASKARRKAKAGAPTEGDHEAHPVISAVREAAAEVGGKGTPTSDQLGNGLGRLLGIVSLSVAVLMVDSDKAITDTQLADQMITYLSLSDDAAKAIMRPIGRALQPTALNRRYGRAVVENVDVVGSVAELVQLGFHWREYLALRARNHAAIAQLAAQQPGPAPVMVPTAAPAAPQSAPVAPAGFVAGADPDTAGGQVLAGADDGQHPTALRAMG